MTFTTPTVVNILARAFRMARARTELLLLLALLFGIIFSFLFRPVMAIFRAAQQILETETTLTEDHIAAAAGVLAQGSGTLLIGHLMVTATASFLLIPWARAAAPGGLIPAAGGRAAFFRRGVRSFLHMVAANGISVLLFLFFMPLVSMLAGLLGGLGALAMMAAFMAMIWLSLAITGTAHLAIAAEARDRQETLMSAWTRGRLFLRAIAGSLAALVFLVMAADIVIGSLLFGMVPPGEFADTLAAVVAGCLIYLLSALHVAGLYIVPDFRDLRPDLFG